MTTRKRRLAAAGAISLAAHATVALAQSAHRSEVPMPAHAPPHPDRPAQPERGPFAVPGVRGETPTLVRRSLSGRLQRLEIDPCVAALEVLDLDDGARQRVLAILDRRHAAIDRVVLENLELLSQARAAAESGQALTLLHIAARVHADFIDLVGDRPLLDQLADVLPAQQARAVRDLVNEYWTALVREEARAEPGPVEAFVLRRRAGLEIFAMEIERTFRTDSSSASR